MSMAETKKEISKRLEPSKRQFHQWHYREGEPIRRVKEMMDELSSYLRKISDYDFRADEDKWRYRQRVWNNEWKIKKAERGLHQPTPGNVSHLLIWQTENGDVGNWRAAALAVNDESQPISPPAEQDMQTSQGATQGFGFWNVRKTSQLERPLNDVCSQSSAATSTSFINTQIPYHSVANIDYRQHEHHLLNTAEIAQWTNSVAAPFMRVHPPMLPYDDHQNSIQYHSQAYSEPYGSNHTTVATLATSVASDGHSTDAVYAAKKNSNPYEGDNTQLTQSPCSTMTVDFGSTASHIHGYHQPSRFHGQDFTYGTQETTSSAQSPPRHSSNQNSRFYEEGSASQGRDGSQTFC